MSGDILVLAGKQVGAATLAWLLETGAPVARVLAGSSEDTAIIACARHHGIPVEICDKELMSAMVAEGRRYGWILSLWNPHLLKSDFLALGQRTLNLHPALVPHCRGMDTAAWIIRTGAPAGVSLLEMDEGVDTGRVWAQRPVDYDFPIRGIDLFQRLQAEIIDLFKTEWPAIYAGREAVAQSGEATSFTRRQTNQDRKVDLDGRPDMADFVRWALAHDFSPGTTAEITVGERRYKFTVHLEELPR